MYVWAWMVVATPFCTDECLLYFTGSLQGSTCDWTASMPLHLPKLPCQLHRQPAVRRYGQQGPRAPSPTGQCTVLATLLPCNFDEPTSVVSEA